MAEDLDLEQLEIRLLLDAVRARYGYDFSGYVPSTLARRVRNATRAEGLSTISGLLDLVLHDATAMERLLAKLLVKVTSMFRDPAFFVVFRRKVVPILETYPFVRIWVAGCSTGEEVYSLAIVLAEEGLGQRARIYATDLSAAALTQARAGVFAVDRMQSYTENYQRAGGERSFSEYYTARYDLARMDPKLTENVFFASHNLATDSSFNEFHLVMCRNVLIYFDRELQQRALDLFFDSLVHFGVLALGESESVRFSGHADDLELLDKRKRMYRKVSR